MRNGQNGSGLTEGRLDFFTQRCRKVLVPRFGITGIFFGEARCDEGFPEL
jgi:hypothetical protein